MRAAASVKHAFVDAHALLYNAQKSWYEWKMVGRMSPVEHWLL